MSTFTPKLSLGIELEYAVICTHGSTTYTKEYLPPAEYNVLHNKVLDIVVTELQEAFVFQYSDAPRTVPKIMAIHVDGTLQKSPSDNSAADSTKSALEAQAASDTQSKELAFWVCQKEAVGAPQRDTHPSTVTFGIEIISPPLLDSDAATSRNAWIKAIECVVSSLDTIRAQKENLGNALPRMQFVYIEEDADDSLTNDGKFRFVLTAPHSAGIHVHVGAGLEAGAKLAESAVRNIAILAWFYEETLNTFHMNHRVSSTNPASPIRSLALNHAPFRDRARVVENAEITLSPLYALDFTKFLDKMRGSEKTWVVNLQTPYATVEFRQLAATFNPHYITAWVRFVLSFVRLACRMSKENVIAVVSQDDGLEDLEGIEACDELVLHVREVKANEE